MPEPRTYRPACLLRLFVRLADFGASDDSDAQDGAQPYAEPTVQAQSDMAVTEQQLAQALAARGLGQTKSTADAISLSSTSAQQSRQAKASAAGSKSAAGTTGKGDDWAIQFVTVPLELEIEDKGFRDADGLTASFPFQDMPLNPQIIRECMVEAWVGTVKTSDFAGPGTWALQAVPSPTSVRRFKGWVDVEEMEHDEDAGLVHIKARSYVGVLIDGKINAHARAYYPQASDEAITKFVNRILSLYPPTAGTMGDQFRAYWYGADPAQEAKLNRKTFIRSLQTAASRNAAAGQSGSTNVNQQPDPSNEAADPQGQGDAAPAGQVGVPTKSVSEDGTSIWDVITQACELAGCLPLYKPALPAVQASSNGEITTVDPGECLLLCPAETFYDDISQATQIKGGARDGFKRSFTDGNGNVINSDVRFMVWGHNLSKLKMSRKLGKVRPSAVEVRSYNPDADAHLRVMSARYPLHNPKRKHGKGGYSANKMTVKGTGKIDVIRTFLVNGIRDLGMLQATAASLYHQLSRSELTLELETDELASYIDPVASQQAGSLVENHNDAPDLLRLCAGSPVHVTVATKSTNSTNLTICSLSEFYELSGTQIQELMTKQNDRWGTYVVNGSVDQVALNNAIAKIQRAYQAAKLPSVYYCRSIRLKFEAESEFFHCSMELANYMRDADPATMDATNQAINDQRKIHKTSTQGQRQARQAAQTTAIVDRALRVGTGGRGAQ